ncbi:hypothetical protein PCK1_001706 [Pneumocystis canis]|nr:hypothetical protein PCK1_001706 [Pneumocystis canis]
MGILVDSKMSLQDDQNKQYLVDILQRADEIKKELQILSNILFQHNVDMETPLIDADGFPRSDIDIVAGIIRMARARINCLKSDYHALINNIQAILHALHDSNVSNDSKETLKEQVYEPYARVNYKKIDLLITREVESKETDINLTLIPQKNWGGSGSLGAHIIPI